MTLPEATEALALWGGTGAPRLIGERENAVYEIAFPDGTQAALRLHRRGYQSFEAIRSELSWMATLAEAGLPVPRPRPCREGDLVRMLGTGRSASVVGWLAGVPLGLAGVPLTEGAVARFGQVGGLLARVHTATDAMVLPPGFVRPHWDEAGLLGEAPLWGRFWEHPLLSDAEAALLVKARDAARAALAECRAEGADFGLIHADPMRENLLVTGDRISLIDFDDCGFGFRLYDLGALMLQNLEEPSRDALLDAALDGYEAVRPLGRWRGRVGLFVMLRTLASCGWAVPRMARDDPRLRVYADRALREARLYLAG